MVGIVVNLFATWLISKANRSSLNVEGAFQHILNDLFAFIATALAGLVVLLTGFARADAIAALVVAALMLKAGVSLVRDSGRIFLEAAPAAIDPQALGAELCAIEGVVEVHDLHVWEITSGEPAASAHVMVGRGPGLSPDPRRDRDAARRAPRADSFDAAGRPRQRQRHRRALLGRARHRAPLDHRCWTRT